MKSTCRRRPGRQARDLGRLPNKNFGPKDRHSSQLARRATFRPLRDRSTSHGHRVPHFWARRTQNFGAFGSKMGYPAAVGPRKGQKYPIFDPKLGHLAAVGRQKWARFGPQPRRRAPFWPKKSQILVHLWTKNGLKLHRNRCNFKSSSPEASK